MEKESIPNMSYLCSISQQGENGFSIYGGNKGGFSSTVLEGMPYSKDSGPYLMTYDPQEKTLTIKSL
jgi:hypothetical protein